MSGLTPAFLALLFFLCISLLSSKKDSIIVPIIIAMCFLPADKAILIGSLNFKAIRILALVGLVKLYFVGQTKFKFNIIDYLFITYNLYGSIIYIIASQNMFGAFIYRAGTFIDSIILYIVFRNCIRTKESIRLITKTFYWCVIALLPFTIFEFFLGYNLFSILGRSSIVMRHGEIRAAATFSHSILFGSFAAAIFPVLWTDFINEKKIFKCVGVLSCIFFVIACSSSGPIVALAAAICFLCFFRWKQYSIYLAWSILFTALFIQLVRVKSIWHFLYLRLPLKGSSTGFHRYLLTEAATKDFKDWWFFGYGDLGPQWHLKYWPWTHAHFTDVTNQYILEAVRGGFLTMIGFMALCYIATKTLGKFSISQKNIQEQRVWWGFTVMMLAHCISFLSVAYFGQITMLFFLSIALAAYAHDESSTMEIHKND